MRNEKPPLRPNAGRLGRRLMQRQNTASILLVTALALAAGALGQGSTSPQNTDVPSILERMQSSDLHTQKLAFDDLMAYVESQAPANTSSSQTGEPREALQRFLAKHPDQADPIKLQLIALLSEENNYFIANKNPPPDPYTDDDISEHYAELIDTVASLNDERAIPALVGAMTTGGMAQRGVLKYGDQALALVLAQLSSPDALVRASALKMATAILQAEKDPASHTQMIALLESALKDPGAVVRTQAIWEIDCLPDRQSFVPELQQIAKTDPDKLPGRADDDGDGDAFYPVRYDARRALRHIQNNAACGAQ